MLIVVGGFVAVVFAITRPLPRHETHGCTERIERSERTCDVIDR
jgi:hypothetical protein